MYKIFINDRPLILTDKKAKYASSAEQIVLDFNNEDDLIKSIYALENFKAKSAVIINTDLDFLWKFFKSLYQIIEAAGGLVQNTNGEYLLIFRNGKWDLPKGKLENSEAPDKAALREVEEECGISNMRITSVLPNTYHTYEFKSSTKILKLSHWYAMSYDGNEELVPQLNEGIVKAIWLGRVQIQQKLSNTYSSVREMLEGLV